MKGILPVLLFCFLSSQTVVSNFYAMCFRPHGQHSVVLAEDAAKYMDTHGVRSDPGPIVSDSRQIYLTFPAESTFTEEDVFAYFKYATQHVTFFMCFAFY